MSYNGIFLTEFERLKKTGMKFSSFTLKIFAKHLICTFDKDEYYVTVISDKNQMSFIELVKSGWTSRFMESNNVVIRRQTRKYQSMDDVKEAIERRVAYLLSQLAWDLSSRFIYKENV